MQKRIHGVIVGVISIIKRYSNTDRMGEEEGGGEGIRAQDITQVMLMTLLDNSVEKFHKCKYPLANNSEAKSVPAGWAHSLVFLRNVVFLPF